MNTCCDLNFLGKYCTEDGTTVLAWAHLVDGVPVIQYFNLSDGLPYTGVVYIDACGAGGSPANVVNVTADTTTAVTDAALTGTVIAILTDGGGVITENFTQVGTTVTLTAGSWSVGQLLTIIQT